MGTAGGEQVEDVELQCGYHFCVSPLMQHPPTDAPGWEEWVSDLSAVLEPKELV